MRKLAMVSSTVTPVCMKMLPSAAISRKQAATRDGELKIKESMTPVKAPSSQRARRRIRRKNRQRATACRRFFCLERYSRCAEVIFIVSSIHITSDWRVRPAALPTDG